MSKITKKKGGSYKIGIFVFIVLGYSLYSLLFNNQLSVEIYDKEFEEMMLTNNVSKVVCIKNHEIVNVFIKNNKESIYECINILNKSRGLNIFSYKNGILDYLRGLLAKERALSFYMTIPSVRLFDKNFKNIEKLMDEGNRIGYEVTTYTTWMTIFTKVLSLMFSLFFLYYILLSIGLVKGGNGGISGALFGKSKGRLFDKNSKNKITFDDVAGLIEPKNECKEIIKLMKNSKKLSEIGGKMPKGILFVGPPGNGKTLLAKAIAGECDASFFYISASDVGGIFYGLGVSHIRSLFKEAKEHGPSIIFIDEIDSIGRSRSNSSRGNDDQENTLNALLVEMDGFDTNSDILVIGSTNRVDVLDKALLRPGRFDVKILIDRPVLKEREEILDYYIKKLKINKDEIDIHRLAEQTVDFSAAEIAKVCNEAALLAIREDKEEINWADFQEAMDRLIAGLEKKSRVLSEEEKRMVSYHESGHVLSSWFLKHSHPLLKVTIISRGYSLGYAQYTPKEQFIRTKQEMIDDLCTYLGGRCSEELNFNTMSTGAGNDLANVYRIAFNIVTIFGMNDKIGRISYGEAIQNNDYFAGKPYSEATAKIIDEEIKKLVDKCYLRVKKLLTEKKELLDKLANKLYENEILVKEDIERIIGPREPFFDEFKESE